MKWNEMRAPNAYENHYGFLQYTQAPRSHKLPYGGDSDKDQ